MRAVLPCSLRGLAFAWLASAGCGSDVAVNEVQAVGGAEVVINEVMYHPEHAVGTAEPAGEEYVELLNTDPANAVSLHRWSFRSGVRLTFPDVRIPAGGYLVVSADPIAFAARHPTVTAPVVGPWSGRLSNSGEKLRIADAFGNEVDEVIYSDQGDWALRRRSKRDNRHRGWVWRTDADGAGSSLELRNPALTNGEGQNWAASTAAGGTPGAPNSAFDTDIAPLIRDVVHSPAIPASSDPVTVTARLTDEEAAGVSATAYYRAATLSPGAFLSRPMLDDGRNGDGGAADGVFGAILPAFAHGTVVEFYVEASDTTGNIRSWPAPTRRNGTQGANALYQVEDAAPAAHDDLPVYRLILSATEDAAFAFGNFNALSDAQMNATFIAEIGDHTDVRYLAGVRRRGEGARRRGPRTLRLNLARDRSWDGAMQMNLNAQFSYLQVLAHELFAAAGLPVATARRVKLFINGLDEGSDTRRQYGIYAHLEPQGSVAVAHQFPEDSSGNLYRKRRPRSNLAYRSGDVAAYIADGWSKYTNESQWDWADLDTWLRAINDSSNPDYLANLEAVMDVDQWLRWFAVTALLNNGETNPGNGIDDDFFVYIGVQDARVKVIPHDLDTILGQGDRTAFTDPTRSIYDMIEVDDAIPVLAAIMRHPQVVPRYHHALRQLIAGPFAKASFDDLLDGYLGSWVPAEIRGEIVSFMDARRAYVLPLVEPVHVAVR